MGSLCADDQMDEVHCLWALCPHPCCWEAERRIAKGIYRHAVRAPAPKHGTNPEGEVHSLSFKIIIVLQTPGLKIQSVIFKLLLRS